MQCIFPDEVPLTALIRAGGEMGLVARYDALKGVMLFERPTEHQTPAMTKAMHEHKRIAERWRVRFGYMRRGGFVTIYQGEARGWFAELCAEVANTFCPGVVAVGADGTFHITRGGDDQNGALRWEPWDGVGA